MNEQPDDAPGTRSAATFELYDRAGPPLGQRLVAAREGHGWSQTDVAARLKLPAKLIARLESDDYEGLSQGVFLRGYLGSYARLVGVPVEQAMRVAAEHMEAAPLVATGTISRSRYLFDRYSVSATYLVLTAIIVVPAVWLATHGGLEQNLARTTPLDPPAAVATPNETASVAASAQPATDNVAENVSAATPASTASTPPVTPAARDQGPVIASMAPFPAAPSSAQMAVSAPNAAAAGSGGGTHTLSLKLAQQSWVEITAQDGHKLEYGILAAGSEHSYRSDGPLSVRLGNVQGAELRTDGNVIDLGQFQRGNVAHLTLFGAPGASVRRAEQ